MPKSSLKTTIRIVKDAGKVERYAFKNVDKAFRYIGKAIERQAKRSIRKGTKNRPHSLPGGPAFSRSGIFKKTISFEYDKGRKEVIAGPILFRRNNRADGAKAMNKTMPRTLEYGGKILAPRPTYIPAAYADARARKIAYLKKKQEYRKKGRKFKTSDLKWVKIPAGTRNVEARPTMRLAYQKIVLANNKGIKRAFARAGVDQTRLGS